jgi:hypothetical protein
LEERSWTDWINPHLALPLISTYINIPKTRHDLEDRKLDKLEIGTHLSFQLQDLNLTQIGA